MPALLQYECNRANWDMLLMLQEFQNNGLSDERIVDQIDEIKWSLHASGVLLMQTGYIITFDPTFGSD